MDLHMPLMDGFEATRRIRSHPGSSLLPVIALTADVFAETRHKAAEAGMTAFISKPVNAGVLQATMTDLFGVRGAPAQPGTRTESEPPSAMNAQAQTGVPVTAPRKPRRRFRPGDLETHMDMKMVGEVCIGVSAKGYRSLLGSFFQDESGAMDALLLAMRNTGSPELSSTAHAFKGAAANLGFHRLAAMALSLEKAQPGSDTGLPSPDELLEAWGMAHALCLRMGLTDIEALQERHICAPDESGG
jgi:CheY-like chemotaxis protein/HPt (histidine-containing phosphotransfer) domain-containing protein